MPAFRPGHWWRACSKAISWSHYVVSGLDTAVISVDGFVRADRDIFVFQGFLFIDEHFDILAQGSLILPSIAIPRRVCWSAPPPRPRSKAGRLGHRAWRRYRRDDRARACRSHGAETVAAV